MTRGMILVVVMMLCGCRSAKHSAESVEATMVRLDSLHIDKEMEVKVDEWYFYHDTVAAAQCEVAAKLPVRAVRHVEVKKKTASVATTREAEVMQIKEERELTAEAATGNVLSWWWIGVAMAGFLVILNSATL